MRNVEKNIKRKLIDLMIKFDLELKLWYIQFEIKRKNIK